MEKHSDLEIPLPTEFDIQEVEDNSEEQEGAIVIEGGQIQEWRDSGWFERAQLYITCIVLSVWIAYTLTCLVKYITSGNPSLLAIDVNAPLLVILAYYFHRKTNRKQGRKTWNRERHKANKESSLISPPKHSGDSKT